MLSILSFIERFLGRLEQTFNRQPKRKERPKQAAYIKFNVLLKHVYYYGVSKMSIKAGQSVIVHIDPRDAFGNPAKIDGLPVWSVSNPELASAEALDDSGLRIKVTSLGHIGQVTVDVTVDADLSAGVRTLKGQLVLDIEAGEAVDLGFEVEPMLGRQGGPLQTQWAKEE